MNVANRKIEPGADPRIGLNWRVLGILNLYRVLVPLVLLGLYWLGGSRGLPIESPQLFQAVALTYLCFGFASVVLVRKRMASAHTLTIIQATIDIACLILLLHAAGGIASGLGLLLLLPVGGLAFLLPPRSAFFLAAVTAIAVLVHTIWQQLSGHSDITVYATAGFLGVVLFAIAASASLLATRVREGEDLVRQKDVDLANLADLSQYIVQHLRESLLVVDGADKIRLINESAAEILGDLHAVPGALIGEVSPRLLYSLSTWRRSGSSVEAPATFIAADGARLIQPHFAPLGESSPGPTLIFLEDTSLMAERVQQSKLAALGRLSASIAHEIRNPVGAMSHAGQLLAESPNIGCRRPPAHRHHSQQLGACEHHHQQRSAAVAARIKPADPSFARRLADGIPGASFRKPCRSRSPISACRWTRRISRCDSIRATCTKSSGTYATTRSSTGHRNSTSRPRSASAGSIRAIAPISRLPTAASGIEPQAADRIFEPFFTGRKGGTGLGLFISRELCQLNRAVLLYEPRLGGGSTFRVVFSDPQRWTD